MSEKGPIVRFAPSPTGELHLGGARTALFNWLYARKHRGRYVLRIEDTDRKRSREEYTKQICDSLTWLGLDWDGPLVYQSQRLERYQKAVNQLLAEDSAYRCFCTREDLEKDREHPSKDGTFRYKGRCRKLEDLKIIENLEAGKPFTVRLKIQSGETEFIDRIYGPIKVNHTVIDDFIILRSDGYPTYNLVVVVDDHDMKISHVIRGEDHLSNTPKQILIYKALGYDIPQFAHLPNILGQNKKKLSKREGAAGVQTFREQGYLPEALTNYLALLGWNPDSEEEIFSLSDLIKEFQLKQIQKKGAVYDEKKLQWVSGQHMLSSATDELLHRIRAFDPQWGEDKDDQYLRSIIELMKVRAKSLAELRDRSGIFFKDPETYDSKFARKKWSDNTINIWMKSYTDQLDDLIEWNEETVEDELRSLADREDISAAVLIHAVRLAISGTGAGPSLFSMMVLLGQVVCIRRLLRAINTLPLSPVNGE